MLYIRENLPRLSFFKRIFKHFKFRKNHLSVFEKKKKNHNSASGKMKICLVAGDVLKCNIDDNKGKSVRHII